MGTYIYEKISRCLSVKAYPLPWLSRVLVSHECRPEAGYSGLHGRLFVKQFIIHPKHLYTIIE